MKGKKKTADTINHTLINKIINGTHRAKPKAENEAMDAGLPPNINLSTIPEPKVKKLKMHSPPPPAKVFLPSSVEGLKEKLRILYAEYIAGNTATISMIVEIIKKLCKLGVIDDLECQNVCSSIENMSSDESSSEESMVDSESDADASKEVDFDQLVRATVENLTRNTRRNLHKALRGADKNVTNHVDNFLNGVEEFDDVMQTLAKTEDGLTIKLLLQSIQNTKRRVEKVLDTLRAATTDENFTTALEQLKLFNFISEEEYN